MLHEFIPVLLVTEQASLQQVERLAQRYLEQQFLKGFPHSDFSKWDNFPVPASPLFNLQAATAAIDLAKFTELNKRLTPRVANGKRGHSRKLSENAGDKTQCFCPFIFLCLIPLTLFQLIFMFYVLSPFIKSKCLKRCNTPAPNSKN